MSKHILIGGTIQKIMIASDKMAIKFITDSGDIIARADADCCSDTWIEHIELPALGLPAKVVSVEDLDLPDDGDKGDDVVIAHYGLSICTDKGVMVIDYRNASNGYYGGDLVFPGGYFYGGVHNQNVSTLDWVDLESDI